MPRTRRSSGLSRRGGFSSPVVSLRAKTTALTAPAGTPLGARVAATDPLPARLRVAGPVPAGLAGVLAAVLLDLVLRLAVLLPLAVVLRPAAVLRLAVLRLAVLLRPAVVLRLGVLARPAVVLRLAVLLRPAALPLPVPAAVLLLAVLRLAGLLPPLAVLLRLALLRLALLRFAVPVLRLAVVLVPWRADPVFLAGVDGFSGSVISFLPPSRAYPGQGRRPLRTHTHPPQRPARHPWGMTTISARPASLARTAFASEHRRPAHAVAD